MLKIPTRKLKTIWMAQTGQIEWSNEIHDLFMYELNEEIMYSFLPKKEYVRNLLFHAYRIVLAQFRNVVSI